MTHPSDRPGFVAELHDLAVADAQVGVGLSLADWLAVIKAHNGGFSLRRALFDENARLQVSRLAEGVYGDDPETNEELARRIDALPLRQKIAVLDVVDRFWMLDHRGPVDLRETLQALGVLFAESAHDRLRAAAAAAD